MANTSNSGMLSETEIVRLVEAISDPPRPIPEYLAEWVVRWAESTRVDNLLLEMVLSGKLDICVSEGNDQIQFCKANPAK